MLSKIRNGSFGRLANRITLVLCLLVWIGNTNLTGQEDTASNEFRKAFDQFLKTSQQDFEAFRNANDSIFHGFLKAAWKEFTLFRDKKPAPPKPEEQPTIQIKKVESQEIQPVIRKTMLQDSGKQLQLQSVPRQYNEYKPAKKTRQFNFYGTSMDVFRIPGMAGWTAPASRENVADYFITAVQNDDLVYAVFDLYNKAAYRKLNDWGFVRLLQEAAASLYGNMDEQVLFTWTALIKTGHDARIGLQQENLFLLVHFDMPVYYSSYLKKGNKKYYLVPFPGQKEMGESITSVAADYPGELHPVSLKITNNPSFDSRVSQRKVNFRGENHTIRYDQNLVDFYRSYPNCDLSLYFPPPLSSSALAAFDDLLGKNLKNNNTTARVNVLLDFIQHSMAYDTDKEQFGYEHYLFAEESLFYPFIDCEDRTVLLSQLIDHYLGLETIALAFPGHVTLAVHIPETVEGSYVKYRNKKFYVCDPTYIGSKCGMLMPEFANVNPEIITYKINSP